VCSFESLNNELKLMNLLKFMTGKSFAKEYGRYINKRETNSITDK
jgi:hypothetical protein